MVLEYVCPLNRLFKGGIPSLLIIEILGSQVNDVISIQPFPSENHHINFALA